MLARADTRRTLVVGVSAVDSLPVVVTGRVEREGVGVGHATVGDRLGAGIACAFRAGVVGVGGVGHSTAGIWRSASERGRVVDRAADRDLLVGERGGDRWLRILLVGVEAGRGSTTGHIDGGSLVAGSCGVFAGVCTRQAFE